jgi:oxygen-independent coproporphyrinogen-3 oxidase
MAVLAEFDAAPMARRDRDIAVYVHWPFCGAKCPYCDFNSHVRRGGIDETRFARAYGAELRHMAERVQGRTVTSIFFGGGTPSLMAPRTVSAIIDEIAALWVLASDAEITLEANPTSVEADRFAGYRTAGVNRLSLGVQSLNEADLKALGRLHSVDEAIAALEIARATFPRVSFDLIYARPGQEAGPWADELSRALSLAADHLSAYQLTIEEDTPFFDLAARGRLKTPGEDLARALYDVTQELCEKAGLPAYEISNHAVSGGESRHNLTYWRGGEYVGVGAGAHGRIVEAGRRVATETHKRPEAWLEQVERAGHGVLAEEALSREDMAREYLLMGLRLREGISLARYEKIAGQPLSAARICPLADLGLVENPAPDRLRASRSGRPLLNSVIAALTD